MRSAWWLSLPCCLMALHCTCAERGAPADALEVFRPLLDRLPPQADVLIIADLAEAARTVRGFIERIEKTPVVAENPPLRSAVQQARAQLDERLAQLKERSGIDALADLERAALALRFSADADPEFALAVRGKFPKGSLGKLLPADARRIEPGREAYLLEGKMFVELAPEGILILASTGRAAGPPAVKDSSQQLLDAHPHLLAPPAPGMWLRLSFVMPKWLQDSLPAGAAMRWAVSDLERVELTLGPGLTLLAEGTRERAVENLRLLAEGWKEFTIGGRNLWRAYIFLGLGLDVPMLLEPPPELRSVLENRKAILASMEEFLGEPAIEPEVRVEGRRVWLHVSGPSLMGSTFSLGIVAAIAIPAFIHYIHRADRERVEEMVDRFGADALAPQ